MLSKASTVDSSEGARLVPSQSLTLSTAVYSLGQRLYRLLTPFTLLFGFRASRCLFYFMSDNALVSGMQIVPDIVMDLDLSLGCRSLGLA